MLVPLLCHLECAFRCAPLQLVECMHAVEQTDSGATHIATALPSTARSNCHPMTERLAIQLSAVEGVSCRVLTH